MTLLWDLDLNAVDFPDFVHRCFAPAKRLPFYICWRCMAASYRLAENNRLNCFQFDISTGNLTADESPFLDSPVVLPRRPISFEGIPSTIDALLALEEIVGLEKLDTDARALLNRYYGREIESTWELPFSVFGGPLVLYQPHSHRVCPNHHCPGSRLSHPFGELEFNYLMKEMALLHMDAEPELERHDFQLVYYVCWICSAIRAEYRCD